MDDMFRKYSTKDFIKKTEKGTIDLERSKNFVKELAQKSKSYEDHNILIDLRETESTLSFGNLLEVVAEFILHKDSYKNKMAVIMPNEPERIKRAEYVKNILKIEDFQLEYFIDYEKAIEWLSTIDTL